MQHLSRAGTGWFRKIVYICTLSAAAGASGQTCEQWYVSPFGDDRCAGTVDAPLRTLTAAQTRVRQGIAAGHTGDFEVILRAGIYELSEPLQFGREDSPQPGQTVTYRAADGEIALLSGGEPIGGWTQGADGVWSAAASNASDAPGAAATSAPPRQLFLDDRRMIRARQPNGGYARVVAAGPDHRTSFQYDPQAGTLPQQADGLECVFLHDWSISRVPLAAVEASSATVRLAAPIGAAHDFFRIDGFEPNPRIFWENAGEFLDAADEFYFDRQQGTWRIALPPNESPHGRRVVVPCLDRLVEIAGTADRPIRGLRLVGLQFRHTSAPLPAGGCAEVQAGFFQRPGSGGASPLDPAGESGNDRLPGALEISNATDIQVIGCTFCQLGGGGVYLNQRVDDCRITGCCFSDIGACGVMIGETNSVWDRQGQNLASRGNAVENCRISRCGQLLFGSVGIWVGIAQATSIADNEICQLPYTGVSVGWRWDREPTGCRDNHVVRNHIHHVMQTLSDGGGIYTLGRQPGTVLEGNRIHAVPLNAGRAESNGIFMDEGSSQIVVVGNEIFDVARSPIRFHKATDDTIRGNRLTPPAGIEPFRFNATEPAEIRFDANEILTDAGKQPSDPASQPPQR